MRNKKGLKAGSGSNGTGSLRGLVGEAYRYLEISRIRESIVNTLKENKKKTVMFTSPADGAGNTAAVALVGYNAAFFEGMQVLLVDLNMRQPELHNLFGLSQDRGFSDVIKGAVTWREAVKESGLSTLKLINAGRLDGDLSRFVRRGVLAGLFREMTAEYDMILVDSSPVLVYNRNNVDPVLLSGIFDMVVMVVQNNRTRKNEYREALESVARAGGRLVGVVHNRQF